MNLSRDKNKKVAKYILSVDGGGIRGIIPAIILAEIESRTKSQFPRFLI